MWRRFPSAVLLRAAEGVLVIFIAVPDGRILFCPFVTFFFQEFELPNAFLEAFDFFDIPRVAVIVSIASCGESMVAITVIPSVVGHGSDAK